jgi:hypothetical protein
MSGGSWVQSLVWPSFLFNRMKGRRRWGIVLPITITILVDTTMVTSPGNVDLHVLFVYIYSPNHPNSQTIPLCYKFFFSFLIFTNRLFVMFLPPTSRFNPVVTTLILNEYQQSSNSSVSSSWFQRQLRMPIARYCLSVDLVWVRSSIDS